METKLFEVRDRATFIPVMATKMATADEGEYYLLRRTGFNPTRPMIMLTRISHNITHCDPSDWGSNPSTMREAHLHIVQNFDDLETGAVICLEHVRGERSTPKKSERLEHPILDW